MHLALEAFNQVIYMSAFAYHEDVSREFDSASDHGAAVISGSFLDEILREILLEFLITDEKRDKDLFEGHGALATFSSKIQLCYRLGLISAGEMKLLNTVRGIRNEFVHKLGGISFKTQFIADRCKAISIPEEMITPEFIPLPLDDGSIPNLVIEKASLDNPRSLFKEAIMHLMNVLAGRLINAKREKREELEEFHWATEPREEMLEYYEERLEQYQEELGQLAARVEELEEELEESNPQGAEGEQLRERLEQLKLECAPVADDDKFKKHQILIKVLKYCIEQINRAKAARY
jgi:hypothetical protein